MEEMRNPQSKAEKYAYDSGPLTVDTEISRSKLLGDRHFGGS